MKFSFVALKWLTVVVAHWSAFFVVAKRSAEGGSLENSSTSALPRGDY